MATKTAIKNPVLNCEFGNICLSSAVSSILFVEGAIGSALNGPFAI